MSASASAPQSHGVLRMQALYTGSRRGREGTMTERDDWADLENLSPNGPQRPVSPENRLCVPDPPTFPLLDPFRLHPALLRTRIKDGGIDAIAVTKPPPS